MTVEPVLFVSIILYRPLFVARRKMEAFYVHSFSAKVITYFVSKANYRSGTVAKERGILSVTEPQVNTHKMPRAKGQRLPKSYMTRACNTKEANTVLVCGSVPTKKRGNPCQLR